MNIDEPTRIELNGITSAAEQLQRLAMVPSKIEVELWKYNSNPVLKDTDFDGIDDGLGKEKLREIERSYGLTDDETDDVKLRAIHCKFIPDSVVQTLRKDKNPKDNHFTGRMNTSRLSGDSAIEVDMNMDYRYFFLSNKQYYDELSTMSLLYANSIYKQGDGQPMHSGIVIANDLNIAEDSETEQMTLRGKRYKNLKVKDLMEFYGFKDVRTYYMGSPGDEGDENKDYFEEFRDINTHQISIPTSKIDTSYNKIGTKYQNKDEIYLGYKDTHKGRVAIGYKTMQYHGLYKTVIGIVIRGTAEDDDWDSDFDMGDKKLKEELKYESGKEKYDHNYNEILKVIDKGVLDYDKQYAQELLHFAGGYPDWKWTYHHAGFDIVANRILEVVNSYYAEVHTRFDELIELMDENTIDTPIISNSRRSDNFDGVTDAGVCYWVTGHSMGAGVANLVAASLISSEAIPEISELEGTSDNVYCYTFAAPNTFYRPDNQYSYESRAIPGKKVMGDYREPKGVKYRCIFNIVNDDDFVPKLPMEECEWTRYGRVGNKSVKIEYPRNYEKLNIRTTLSAGYNPITTNYTLYYFLTTYKGNPGVPTSIAKGFAEIFDNKSQMRYETYSNEEFINILKQKGTNVNGGMPVYTLPYQKLVKIGEKNVQKGDIVYTKEVYRQKQKPAFVFQLVANARHEYVINRNNDQKEKDPLWNKTVLLATPLPGKYSKAVNKLVIDNDPLRLNYIYLESPHCLESYYSLTKIINTIDFQ